MLPLLLSLPLLAAAQDGTPPPETQAALAEASPRARAAWNRFLAAARPAEARAPITAFRLHANGLRRDGVQTNETDFDYSYLAPDCIRFALPDGNETGRSGRKQRDYWKRDRTGATTRLVGRDFAQDRRLVAQMHALARNYVALASPDALHITSLEALTGPPPGLWKKLARQTRDLTWISVTSPDFALFLDDADAEEGARTFRVDLALGTEEGERDLPLVARILELSGPDGKLHAPLLVRLSDYVPVDGVPVPTVLLVHALDPEAPSTAPRFAPDPIQEIYVLEADLWPDWTVADFDPSSERFRPAEDH